MENWPALICVASIVVMFVLLPLASVATDSKAYSSSFTRGEPTLSTTPPILGGVSEGAALAVLAVVVAIHSTRDEFVSVDEVKRVMSRALAPKQLWLIETLNHQFAGKEQDLNQKLLEAIAWITAQRH